MMHQFYFNYSGMQGIQRIPEIPFRAGQIPQFLHEPQTAHTVKPW